MGVGDYNNDGKSDNLWQNSSGPVAVWEMNGASDLGAAIIAKPGANLARVKASHRELLPVLSSP